MDLLVKRLQPTAKLPEYAHASDAGMDLFSVGTLTIPAGERALVATGIALAIPSGYVGLVWDKSGLATQAGLTTLAGVIDAGYRGEIQIALLNTEQTAYNIQAGQKIAQLLIQPIEHPNLIATIDLPPADRGANGFGSTGLWSNWSSHF